MDVEVEVTVRLKRSDVGGRITPEHLLLGLARSLHLSHSEAEIIYEGKRVVYDPLADDMGHHDPEVTGRDDRHDEAVRLEDDDPTQGEP